MPSESPKTLKILKTAEEQCTQAGARLTPKRKRVLKTLIQAKSPLSAYEITDQYNKTYEDDIAPMSVYRMLDFLMSQELVHKLESTNKFLVCSHILCDHGHGTSQFLICSQCDQVYEVALKKEVIDALKNSADSVDFDLSNKQIELVGRCKVC